MSKKTALGRVAPNAQSTFRLVDVSLLVLNEDNEREYTDLNEGVEEKIKSLRASGLQSPLHIYDDGVVDDGNKRLFGMRKLITEEGWVPFGPATEDGAIKTLIVPRPASKKEAVLRRLNVNEAKQFGPLAQGKAFATLRGEGMNNSEIAKETPFTSMHVGNMLTLHDASDAVRDIVREGQMSATLAVETIRKFGENVVVEAVQAAIAEGKEKATQRHVDAVTAGAQEAPEVEADVEDDTPPFDTGSDERVVETEVLPPEVEGEPEAEADADAEPETGAPAPAPTAGDEVDSFKFTAAVAKSMIESFTIHAKKWQDGEITTDEFKAELDMFMVEAATYGLTV